MNTLSIMQRHPSWKSNNTFPMFAVDGILFNDWLYQFKKETEEEFAVNILMPIIDLCRQDEIETFWQYLGQIKSEGTHYVPLLTCPDDLDLVCNVVMTEQVVKGNRVYWKRFGWNMGFVNEQDPTRITWFDKKVPELCFSLDNFSNVFSNLNQIVIKKWFKNNQVKLEIPFPAKEDWELILDSWYD